MLNKPKEKLHTRIKSHLKAHHRKYFFGIFGGRAIFKTMVLLMGAFGLINSEISTTLAQEEQQSYNLEINNDPVLISEETQSPPDQFNLILEGGTEEEILPIIESDSVSSPASAVVVSETKQSELETIIVTAPEEIQLIEEEFLSKGFIKDSEGKFKGTDNLDLATTNGKILVPLTLESEDDTAGQKIQVDIPEGTIVKNREQNNYQDIINAPQFLDKNQLESSPANDIVAVMQVGNPSESISFEDEEGNNILIDITIPVPEKNPGDRVQIYYSENTSNWTPLQETIVTDERVVTFKTSHFTTFVITAITRENLNFLSKRFWTDNPTSGQIIRALYGGGSGSSEKTAYTSFWTGNVGCLTGSMSVVFTGAGGNRLPATLVANTIYVLAGGTYTGSSQITFGGDCIAIVATGDATYYSTTNINGGLLFASGKQFLIIDNLKIDGFNDGGGGTHLGGKNFHGIELIGNTKNSTMNRVSSFLNANYGININNSAFLVGGTYIHITNSQFYNNTGSSNAGGIGVTLADHNLFNNILSYNNTKGIFITQSDYNTINNSQFFNNTNYGIETNGESDSMTINNSQVYNNNADGVFITSNVSSKSNIINDSSFYNNSGYGITGNSTSSGKSYGIISLFSNTTNTLPTFITTGNKSDTVITNLSTRTTGSISTAGTTGCYVTTNPRNGSGTSFLTTANCDTKGNIGRSITTSTINTITYFFGTGIMKQEQPVQYSGITNVLKYYGTGNADWNTSKYIGEYSIECDFGWDNNNFITGRFWDQMPTNECIIYALYGNASDTVTAYSQNRSGYTYGSCLSGGISIINRSAGTGQIDYTMAGRQIFVLSSGNYIQTGTINMSGCNAILGKTGNIFLYSTVELASAGMIDITSKQYTIFDNIKINGTGGGPVIGHIWNGFGIQYTSSPNGTVNNSQFYNNNQGILFNSSPNGTVNNSQSYNNGIAGIRFVISGSGTVNNSQTYNNTNDGINFASSSSNGIVNNSQSYNNTNAGIIFRQGSLNGTINNSQSYNNDIGISIIVTSNFNSINNSQTYNNTNAGIHYDACLNCSVNNSQIYNNNGTGVNYRNASKSGIINNSQIYNNSGIGIAYNDTSQFMSINNSQIYNNIIGIQLAVGATSKYYGTGYLFGNTTDIGGTVANLSTGNASDFTGVGRTTGVLLQTGTMSRDYITNPRNGSGNYMLPWTGNFTKGRLTGFGFTGITTYSFGSGIITQIQPVRWSGTSQLINSGTYNSGNFIGSDTIKVTGSLIGLPVGYTYQAFLIVTGISVSPITNYSLFGNITNQIYGAPINTSTGITLTSEPGTKSIITQFFGTNAFATHFQNTVNYDAINCSNYTWDNDNFITGGFWDQNPSSECIIYALYGNSSDTSTAYTENRSNYSYGSCVSGTITVNYRTGGTGKIDYTMTGRQIFVLSSGEYIQTGAISMSGCTAIIGTTGNIILYSTINLGANTGMINIYGRTNTILDNIKINGTGGIGGIPVPSHTANQYGIFYKLSSSNGTINNSQTYNNTNNGIYFSQTSNGTVNNSKSYNNGAAGITFFSTSNNGIINNSQFYNNSQYGIEINNTNFNTINNTQIYNNGNWGISYASIGSGTINNSQIYNNGVGIYIQGANSKNNNINNSQFYNNSTGIFLDNQTTNNKYYGNTYLFGNTVDIIGQTVTNLITGNASDFTGVGRITGVLLQTGIMSRDYITNPRNGSGNYLLSWTGTFSSLIGAKTFVSVLPITYSFGSGIATQQQPVIRSGTNQLINSGTYNSGQYIGSDLTKVTGSLIGLPSGLTSQSSWTVTGLSSSVFINKYSLFGNITNQILGVTINSSTGITLTESAGTKRIITQLSGSNYFASHFETSLEYDPIVCNFVWDNNNFITGGFRDNNPTPECIIYALYGNASDTVTAYSQNRSGYTYGSCLSGGMSVINRSAGTGQIDYTMAGRQIFVLSSGNYIQTGTINMSGCNTIIGKTGNIILYSTASLPNGMINITSRQYTVIENLQTNGTGGGPVIVHPSNTYGILSESSSNGTINNCQLYRNNYGIMYDGLQNSNSVNNSQIYNNNNDGIYYWQASKSRINNCQIYNNVSDGVEYSVSSNSNLNTINNSQIYNNSQYGLYSLGSGSTVNNSQIYNNGAGGIVFGDRNSTVNNSKSYNNAGDGIYISQSNGIVNNSQSYNNAGDGIDIRAPNSTVNNSQSYNNANGIEYNGINFLGISSGIINNSQIYNNATYGIFYINVARNNSINNSQIYNNTTGIFLEATSTGNKYYGTSYLFANIVNIGGSGVNLSTGNATEVTGVSRTTGILLQTGIMSRDYITNPRNGSGNYLLNWTGAFTKGRITTLGFTGTIAYSFGSGIITQQQPVIRSGTSQLINSGTYNTGQYIGSDVTKITGNLVGLPTFTNTTGWIVTGLSDSILINSYSLFGNIINQIVGVTINTSTGIVLSAVAGTKRIITQLSGDNYFASHFETKLDYESIYCSGSTWDNDNFITGGFWDLNPSPECIIYALYGNTNDTVTAYTKNRSGYSYNSCLSGGLLTVNYRTGGTGKIDYNMAINQIFVLSPGEYIQTGNINMNGCTTIIGQTGNVILYSTGKLTPNGMINITSSKQYTIIDNIKINGTGEGPVTGHAINDIGIQYNIATNGTINNSQSYNNLWGIFFQSVSNINIYNSKIYNNNQYGLNSASSPNCTINNSQIYNNSTNGMFFQSSSNRTVNNSLIYNNGTGIASNTSSSGVINNSQFYNNNLGVSYISNSKFNLINNSQFYNNNSGIQLDATSTGNKYYGTSYLFVNSTGIFGTTVNLSTGGGEYFTSLGRTTGTLVQTGIMSRDYITNPRNGSSNYMLPWTGAFTKGKLTGFTFIQPITYSFGSGIATQQQPVLWSGTTQLITGGVYNSGQYIGSDLTKVSGSLVGLPTGFTSQLSWTVTGFSNSPFVKRYSLFGNITNQIVGVLTGTSTGITLTNGGGTKRVITQFSGTEYFASHFETTVNYDSIGCDFTRDNDNFITGGFWDQNPTTGCIIYALYGNSNDTATAYTQNRTGYSYNSCVSGTMTVNYRTGGIGKIDYTMTGNQIFVLSSGDYIQTGAISMSGCTTIIGQTGNIILYSTGYLGNNTGMVNINTKQYTILDNIKINGTGGGPVAAHPGNIYGISYTSATNGTINNSEIYNSETDGIVYNLSNFHTINNSEIYSNTGLYGVQYATSNFGTINNSQIYNNNNRGVGYDANSASNTINNTQIYNNANGVFYNGADFNTINNSQIYNNSGSYGILYFVAATNNSINNSKIYNNSSIAGIFLSINASNNKYYGTSYLFANTGSNIGGSGVNLSTGGANDFSGVGRTTGALIQTGILGRNYITNPKNGSGEYLLGRSENFDILRGTKIFSIIHPITYSFGGIGISTQQQAVRRSGATLVNGRIYNSGQFIGSNVNVISGSISILTTSPTTNPNIQVIFTSAVNANWTILGDVTTQKSGFIIGGTSITTGLTISGADGTKDIILQLSTGSDFASHYVASIDYDAIECDAFGWNNDNFITGGFRDLNPDNGCIIYALYGNFTDTSTAYNQNRSGYSYNSCVSGGMTVNYRTGGTGKIDYNMTSNQIFVLSSGNYIQTGTINMGQCTTIIGQTGNIVLYSTGVLSPNGMIKITSKQNTVIDNLIINGTGGGPVAPHGGNVAGVFYFSGSINGTINNIQTFNNGTQGIRIDNSSNDTVNNSQIYNNDTYGILFTNNSSNGTVNNSQSYNNVQFGIYFLTNAPNGTVNNSQSYNNGTDGIAFNGAASSNGRINNSQSYNNLTNGISFTAITGAVNNSQSYNNGVGIIVAAGSKYYGTGYVFGNITNISTPANFTAGGGEYFTGLGRTTGVLITGLSMSRDYITNPRNGSGNYMLPWTGSFGSGRGLKTFISVLPVSYSFGSGILTQQQQVRRSGTTQLVTGWTYNSGQFIGSDLTKVTGSLLGLATGYTNQASVTVTGISTSPITTYSLFGNHILDQIIGVPINTSTGITITTGAGTTRIITQLFGTTYFGMHFETDVDYDPIYCTNFTWDNDNFITGGFWDQNPSPECVIYALYGNRNDTGTAYTNNRSGYSYSSCVSGGITVNYRTGGTGKINYNMTSNQIFVLSSGEYIQTGSINMSGCTAIIGQTGNIMLYSTGSLANGMIFISTKRQTIVDNLQINGTGGGPVVAHTSNTMGIYYSTALNGTINNSKIYNNQYGVYGSTSPNLSINNSQIYNNSNYGVSYNSNSTSCILNNSQAYNNNFGIEYSSASKGTINNSQIYNNGSIGINFSSSLNGTINNTQSYNNSNIGMAFDSSSNSAVNNSQSYNNGSYGIWLRSSPNCTINNSQIDSNNNDGIYSTGSNSLTINNGQIYNNSGYGLFLSTNANNTKYYGTSSIFANTIASIGGSGTHLSTGGGEYFTGLGRTTGVLLQTGTLSRDYITNPRNESGDYMLPWTGNFTKGKITFGFTGSTSYSFGSGILTQIQPVLWSGLTLLMTGGTYNSGQYIGSELTKVTGSLIGLTSGSTSQTSWTVTGIAGSPITTYSLFGNIINQIYGIPINTSTGITFTAAGGTKRIITQLSGSEYFASHFETTVDYSADNCTFPWNNDNFITGGFWDNNPTDGCIIYALYGNSGDTVTAYTRNWSNYSYNSCISGGLTVNYRTGGTGQIDYTMTGNQIFVLSGGDYIQTGTINMSGCTAIIGQTGNIVLWSTGNLGATTGMITINTKQFTIIDTLQINGTGGGPVASHARNQYGIYYSNGTNGTINNSQIYNNSNGIYYINSSNFNSINYSQTYNNNDGIAYVSASNFNTINNSQNYNNSNAGVNYSSSSNFNNINNSQNYNNGQYGIIYSFSSSGIINNSQIYNNNSNGILYSVSAVNNRINNSQIYNNTIGVQLDATATSNKYYGTSSIFANTTNIGGTTTNLITGNANDFTGVGRTTGVLLQTGIMSRDLLTNPRNGSGNYLLSWTGTFTGMRGTKTFISVLPITYTYGSGILLQTQAVLWSGTSILKTGGSFNSGQFIGSQILKYAGSLSGVSAYTNVTGLVVTGLSSQSTNYSLFGSIVTNVIDSVIGISQSIVLSIGDGIKRIITQIYDIFNFATHFETVTILDQTLSTTGVAYISNGTTGQNGNTGYYKGSVDIASNFNDSIGLNTGSCEYTTGGITFSPTLYSGTSTTGNCYVTGLNYQTGLILQFRIRDLATNLATGGSKIYLYDNIGPPKILTGSTYSGAIPTTGFTTGTVRFLRSGVIDTGVGLSGYYRQITTGVNFSSIFSSGYSYTTGSTATGFTATGLASGNYLRRVLGFDYFNTTGSRSDTGSFSVNLTVSCATYTSRWDNSNFITGAFWDHPGLNDCDIIFALYGTGLSGQDTTAYTQYRTGRTGICNYSNMTVVPLTGGTNKINFLTGNKIVVLSSGEYTQTAQIDLNNCSAIVGQTGTIILDGGFGGNSMINIDTIHDTIVDNIKIDGEDSNSAGIFHINSANSTINNIQSHNNTNAGIYYIDSPDGIGLISNSQSYNNNTYGVYAENSPYGIINNSKLYNNLQGIDLNGASNRKINNSQIYNNDEYGIFLGGSPNLIVNNTQIYNHGFNAIYYGGSANGVINNSQIYNNQTDGIYYTDSSNGKINNTKMYNNGNYGIFLDATSTGHKYYGTSYLFANTAGDIGGSGTNLSTGGGEYFTSLGRTTGSLIQNGTMSRDYITNPRNGVGRYLLPWTGSFSKGKQTITFTQPITYSFGSGILTQQQGVTRSGTTQLITGFTYNSGQYIGSELTKITGSLIGLATGFTSQTGWTVTGISTSPITHYSLFGNIVNQIFGVPINTSTGIILITGDVIKRVITQFSGTDYFASHFETTIEADPINCSFGWNNDNFITGGFWNNNPTDGCIIYALYGNSSDTSTAYTQNRNGYNLGSCLSGGMTVNYRTGGTGQIDYTMASNQIFVLSSGNYIQTGSISMSGCTAIIGKTGTIVLYSTGYLGAGTGMININKTNTILDNIKINGTGGGPVNSHQGNDYGIFFTTSTNGTVNNSQIYNHTQYGISMFSFVNGIINNSQIYNNTNGINYIVASTNGIINNSQIYNNSVFGIFYNNNSNYSNINNNQIYNNGAAGVFYNNTSSGAINNNQIYNNASEGINYGPTSRNNKINNSQIYNNGQVGITLSATATGNMYYGTSYVFGNATSGIGGSGINLSTGGGEYFTGLGRTTGVLIQTGTMSRDYITNPRNGSGNYLLAWTGIFTGMRGIQTFSIIHPITYSFGIGITTQQQGVRRSGTTQLITGGIYNSGMYIGSELTKVSGSLIGLPTVYTSITGWTVTGISASPITTYSLFGNIVNQIIGVPINTSTGIVLTTGLNTKRVITQLSGTNYWASHFETSISACIQLTCGQTVTGNVVMCADLDCSAYAGTGLTMSSNSSLDLNGYTITANTGYAGVYSTDTNNFTITSTNGLGTIKSDVYSIYLRNVGSLTGAVNVSNLNLSKPTGAIGGNGIYSYSFNATTQNLHLDNLIIHNRNTAVWLDDVSGGNPSTKHINISLSGIVATGNTNGLYSYGFNQGSGLQLFGNDFSINSAGVTIINMSNIEAARNNVKNNTSVAIYLVRTPGIIPTSPSSDMTFDITSNPNTALKIEGNDNFTISGTGSNASPSTGMYLTEGSNLSGWKILFDSNSLQPIILTNVGSLTGAVIIKNLNLSSTTGTKVGYGIDSFRYNGNTQNLHLENLVIHNRSIAVYIDTVPTGNGDYKNLFISGVVATGNTNGLYMQGYTWGFGPISTGLKLFDNNFDNNTNGISIQYTTNIEAARNTVQYSTSQGLYFNAIAGIIPTSPSSDIAFDIRNSSSIGVYIDSMNNFNIFGSGTNTSPSTGMYMTEGSGNLSGWKILFDNNALQPLYLRNVGSTTSGVNVSNLNLSSTTGTKVGNGIYSYSYNATTENLHLSNLIIHNRQTAVWLDDVSGGNPSTKHVNVSLSGIIATGNTNGLYSYGWVQGSGLKLFNNNFSVNDAGITIINTSNLEATNNTIANNTSYGFSLSTITNGTFNNSQIYNNGTGISFSSVSNRAINNNQIYNNSTYGVYSTNSSKGIINNSQIYSNGTGIYFTSSTGNSINNTQSYNNIGNGIYLSANSTGNKYYGTSSLFANTVNIGGSGINLSAGNASDFPGLGRTTGVLLQAGTMSRDYITNPRNGSGNYMLSWTGLFTGMRGQQTFTFIQPITYSFGSGIALQQQPVLWSGTTQLINSGTYNSGQYIGSDVVKVTGSLIGLPSATNQTGFIVTGLSNSALVKRYSLFGNIITERIGVLTGTSTGITLTAGDGLKRIITQFSGDNYFASHFETSVTYDTSGPLLIFTGATPLSGATLTGNTITGQVDITEANLNIFSRTWNGITYPIYDSGLVLMMNFDNKINLGETTGGIIKDRSQYGNNGSGNGGITRTGNGRRSGAYSFDGIDDNIIANTVASADFSTGMTIGMRINPNTVYSMMASFGDASTNSFVGFEYNSDGKIGINYRPNDNYDYLVKTVNPYITGNWHHVTYTIDFQNRPKIYIDGIEVQTTGHVSIPSPIYTTPFTGISADWFTIGQLRRDSISDTYFSGLMDEFRIYKRVLSSGEVMNLYNSNLAKYNTNKRTFTSLNSCLFDGTYNFAATASDTAINSTTTGRTVTLNLPFSLGVPTSGLSFSGMTIKTSSTTGTIEKRFNDTGSMFSVFDSKGTGWFTTIALSGNKLIGSGNSTNIISGSNIFFKGSGSSITGAVTTIGIYSPDVIISGDLINYKAMTGSLTYLMRNRSTGCSSCIVGQYGSKPAIKINIPPYQAPDIYKGTLIFTQY